MPLTEAEIAELDKLREAVSKVLPKCPACDGKSYAGKIDDDGTIFMYCPKCPEVYGEGPNLKAAIRDYKEH